jgi:GDP-4-dehydro-6-deoxy-D-mannose reductase
LALYSIRNNKGDILNMNKEYIQNEKGQYIKTVSVLITGITGFVGSHLADYILSLNDNYKTFPNPQRYKVYGTIRRRSNKENVKHILDKIELIECEITDFKSVYYTILKSKPDKIFHLAAQSYVPSSWSSPTETINTNVNGTINLFEAVRKIKEEVNNKYNFDPVIQVACSSEEYGLVTENECPIKETNPLRPMSPYGVSKVTQDKLAYQYHKSYGLKTVITRAFNHTGPRRGDVFVCSNFAKQIIHTNRVIHGNLESKRDFTDVRDVVKAYWVATEKCDYGEIYNICSNVSYRMNEILKLLIDIDRKDRWNTEYENYPVHYEKDKSKMRPSDVPILIGDYTKFHEKTGWKPEIPIEKTLKDLLDYWRERI